MVYLCTTIRRLRLYRDRRDLIEPFGIVVVYLQKHDFEKNAIENFRHCHYCNLTQTIDRRDVLYQMVAVLVKLSNKRARTFQRLDMIWKCRILYIDHYSIILLSTTAYRIVVVYCGK